MRIVYLSASGIPSQRANSIQVMRMCEAFAQNGHETTLVGKQFVFDQSLDICRYYGVEKNFELALIPCRRTKGISIVVLPKVYAKLKAYNRREVLVYARDTYAASLAVGMGFRVIYEAHAMPYNRLLRCMEGYLLKSDHLIRLVVISQSLADCYLAKYDVARKLLVCHDAASTPKSCMNADISWPSNRQTLQIGYTGHLYKGRGVEIILACARRLPEYDFHIVGGTEADINYWKSRGTDNLYWHGFMEPSRVPCVSARCDVLLMPYQRHLVNPHSRANTSSWMSPMKLFEYMASHKAIVASDLPVLREVLSEKVAVLVEPADPEQWVNAIRRCEDGTFRQSLADNAYSVFREHYTWEKRAHKVLEGLHT